MASISKQGKKWLAQISVKGQRSGKLFPTKAEAKDWAYEQERMLGKHGKALPRNTFGDAMQKYAEEISPSRKGARWEQIRLKKLKRDKIAAITMPLLRHEDLQDWINRQTISAGSIRRELDLMQSVLRECRLRWKWIHDDICKNLRRPPIPAARDRRVRPKEIEAILVGLKYQEDAPIKLDKHKVAVALLFSLETAMRQSEVWGMDWRDMHLDERYVVLPDTKNGTKREVPLSTRAVELLKKLEPYEGRVFKSSQASAGAMFRQVVKEIKPPIEDLHWHDLRHEAITRLAAKLDVLTLARMVGHKDIRMLQIYYNPTASEIAKRLD